VIKSRINNRGIAGRAAAVDHLQLEVGCFDDRIEGDIKQTQVEAIDGQTLASSAVRG